MLVYLMIYSGLGWIFRGDFYQYFIDIGSIQGCFIFIVNYYQVFGVKSRCYMYFLIIFSFDEFSSKLVWINVENLCGGIYIIV